MTINELKERFDQRLRMLRCLKQSGVLTPEEYVYQERNLEVKRNAYPILTKSLILTEKQLQALRLNTSIRLAIERMRLLGETFGKIPVKNLYLNTFIRRGSDA